MSEKKVVGRTVAIALGIIVITLLVGLVGVITNYASIISGKENTISSLNAQIASKDSQISSLNANYTTLNATYTWLKQHSFTYYTVDDSINVSNIQIFLKFGMWHYVNGTVTNISNKPIESVYVYVLFVNPDGTKDFSPYNYEKIENLYIGETATFEISITDYNESQTVEIFLIY